MTNPRIVPFLEYDKAYQQQRLVEDALDNAVSLLCPDNIGLVIESPFQKVLENQLRQIEPNIWEWYEWWLLECDGGTIPGEFSIDGVEHQVADFELLEDFLNFIAQEYPQ